MADCETFEIAIEMARHGALGEPERTALVRHLSGCASCRAYGFHSFAALAAMVFFCCTDLQFKLPI
jgi:hypothetical protein